MSRIDTKPSALTTPLLPSETQQASSAEISRINSATSNIFSGSKALKIIGMPLIITLFLPVAVNSIAVAVALYCKFCLSKSQKKELVFELSAISRMVSTTTNTFDKIQGHDIYLGSMPNQVSRDYDKMRRENIGAILCVTEEWETMPMGLSQPYTKQQWKEEFGEDSYLRINQKDHTLLDIDNMDRAADFINERIQSGQKVYVHCRGGVGRSATAIAAYLIKYKKLSCDQAIAIIKSSRPSSTIANKKARLEEFASIHSKRS